MSMRGLITSLVLLGSAWALRADVAADSNLPIQEIYAKGLLPIDDVKRGFATPAFKFFEKDQLKGILMGSPGPEKSLKAALHALPEGFRGKLLGDELNTVGLTRSVNEQTVLIYTMNGRCPPCDRIISDVKNQLNGLSWEHAHIFVVNITVPTT
jgi:hypothetical protein